MPLADSVSPILRHLNPEVWIITAADGLRRGGLVSTTLTSISIVPDLPRVSLTLARQHATWELVETSGVFAAHLIAERDVDWVWRFGLNSGRDADKLADVSHRSGATASPILNGALAWIECRVEDRLDTGDRTLYLAEVVAGRLERDEPPLTMHRLLKLAPDDRRQQLRESLDRDGRVDTAAIQAWRARRSQTRP